MLHIFTKPDTKTHTTFKQLYTTIDNSTQQHTTLQSSTTRCTFVQILTQLYNILHSFTNCFTNMLLHSPQLYRTLHILTQLHVLYKTLRNCNTSQNLTKLNNTWQHFTTLYALLQYFTKLYKTTRNCVQVYKNLTQLYHFFYKKRYKLLQMLKHFTHFLCLTKTLHNSTQFYTTFFLY